MEETVITGYCRATDASRVVYAEQTPEGPDISCSFGACPYEPNCPIAQQLAAFFSSSDS